jgi:hypothetical protein
LPVEQIDAVEAQADREHAAAALEGAEFGDPEHETARRELRWAELRLEIARG